MSVIRANQVMQVESEKTRRKHEEKYEQGAAFANGEYCPAGEAMMPLSDMGFAQADAAYEKSTVSHGRYFRLQDHFDRFARSCAKFRLKNPYSNDEMIEIFNELHRLTGLSASGVWWTVTRGLPKGRVIERGNPDSFQNRFYATVTPYYSGFSDEIRMRGLDLLISKRHIRVPPKAIDPTAKNTNWMDMKLSMFEARDGGKDNSVLTDAEGYLTEPAGANIFAVKGGELYTPDTGCLEGITRLSVLELAEMLGIRAHVQRVHSQDLLEADEAFTTTSAGGVMPVNSVDGVVLGGKAGPGELTVKLHNLYWEKMWEGWKGIPVNYASSGKTS